MKQRIFLTAAAILALSATSPAFSQYAKNKQADQQKLFQKSRLFVHSAETDAAVLASLKTANLKMHKDFTKHFRDATNISFRKSGDYTIINCTDNDVKTRVSYDRKGRWTNTLKTLSVKEIPYYISRIVQNSYPEYEIKRGFEVSVGNATAHLVHIENPWRFKCIRIIDGMVDVYKEYTKSNP